MDDKIKEAYRRLVDPVEYLSYELAIAVGLVREAFVDAEARARMAEFKASEHDDTQRGIPCMYGWAKNGNVCLDPRHDFHTFAQWRAEVVKEIEG